MDGKDLVDYLKRKYNARTDSALARYLGVTVTTIRNWSADGMNPRKIHSMLKAFEKAAAERRNVGIAVNLFDKLTEDASLKEALKDIGITPQTASNWKKTGINAQKLNGVISKIQEASRKSANSEAIKPVCEFVPVDRKKAPRSKKWEVIGGSHTKNKYYQGMRKELRESHGIYIFYDSRGRALYVGKAVKQTLWSEINNAYNRSRDAQQVYRIHHPTVNKEFKPQHEKARVVKKHSIALNEMAQYLSVYSVSQGMIDNLEALLIRAFANDLLNVKMENFE